MTGASTASRSVWTRWRRAARRPDARGRRWRGGTARAAGRHGGPLDRPAGDDEDLGRAVRCADQLLGERIGAGPVASPEIRWAWAELHRSGGQLRIGDLAAQVGCSHRHLVACFREQIGVTPKTAARVLRFHHARHLLDACPSPAAVAACCGYSDQSHLSREFTRLAGCTPTEFTRHRSGLSKIPATTPG